MTGFRVALGGAQSLYAQQIPGFAPDISVFGKVIGGGMPLAAFGGKRAVMEQLALDPSRQLLGAQCSGTLVLAKLGLLDGVPACTDLVTKPWVEEAGVCVLNQPFVAHGNDRNFLRQARRTIGLSSRAAATLAT